MDLSTSMMWWRKRVIGVELRGTVFSFTRGEGHWAYCLIFFHFYVPQLPSARRSTSSCLGYSWSPEFKSVHLKIGLLTKMQVYLWHQLGDFHSHFWTYAEVGKMSSYLHIHSQLWSHKVALCLCGPTLSKCPFHRQLSVAFLFFFVRFCTLLWWLHCL
jgi:hypothetical protein